MFLRNGLDSDFTFAFGLAIQSTLVSAKICHVRSKGKKERGGKKKEKGKKKKRKKEKRKKKRRRGKRKKRKKPI